MAIISDLRFAVRVFARRPAVPLLVAALFAMGVGFASGMWAVVDAAVLRPLPYPHGEALVAILENHPQRGRMAVTPANFLDWASRVTTLEAVAGYYPLDSSFIGTGEPERVAGAKVTEAFFDVWSVRPTIGRSITPVDFRNQNRVVVLGHAAWERQFGGDPRAIGAVIHLDGEPYTVIGVMPRTFRTIGGAEIWIPWFMSADEQRERRFHLVSTVARLRTGQSAAEARTELATVYRQLAATYPDTTADWSPQVLRFRDLVLGDSARALIVLGGAVVVLVTVAWMNVASLLLAWLPGRRQEFLVRRALGATGARLVRQLIIETLLWATAGLVAGLAIARSFVRLFGEVGISGALPYDFEPSINGRVITVTAALLLLSVAITAVGPSILAIRRAEDLIPRRALPGYRLRDRVTVAIQVALSLVLITAAAGLMTGFRHLVTLATPQSSAGQTLATEISRSESHEPNDSDNRQFFTRLLTALSQRREIRNVAAASYVPPTRALGNVRFSIDGRATSTESQTALVSAVSDSAFKLLGIPLVRGRFIGERDGGDTARVAVISAALSRRYWAGVNPIGQRIVFVGTDTPVTIVGVVGDVRQPLSDDPRAESVLYVSYQQFPWPFMTVFFVPSVDGTAAVAAVRQELRRIDWSQPAGAVQNLDDLRTEWLGQPRLQTTVVSVFGLATLLLTVVGLYARVANAVNSRAREFAIRQALGARPRDVVRRLILEVLLVTACGVIAGVCVLPLSTRALRNLVIDAPSLDPRIGAAVAFLLVASALCAAYWPARRAGHIDPARILRAE